jgi:hypothetical protein
LSFIYLAGPERWRWGAHFIAVSSAGAWAMAAGKDGDDCGVAAALEEVIGVLVRRCTLNR